MIRLFLRIPQAVGFVAFFLMELLFANVKVARDVIRPLHHLHPGIVAIPIDLKSDLQITLLSSLVTLTPGTLSLDVSADRKTLYVHAMNAAEPDELRRSVKSGFERRVRELFS